MSEWISVKDRLPDDEMTVLITNGEDVEKGYFAKYSYKHQWSKPDWFDEVTHWMPLPKAPND